MMMKMLQMTIWGMLVAITGTTLLAQAPAADQTFLENLKATQYPQIRQNVIAAAELMPAEAYSFRATPQVRTFAEELAHIAQANSRLCRAINDNVLEVSPKFASLDKENSKLNLVNALKETFADCDRAFATLNEQNVSRIFVSPNGRRNPIGSAMTIVVVHSNEEYGKLAMMLRLKGLVPPSTQPAPTQR